jgi:hypothetical protein
MADAIGYVYVMKSSRSNDLKIGYTTTSIEQRERELHICREGGGERERGERGRERTHSTSINLTVSGTEVTKGVSVNPI